MKSMWVAAALLTGGMVLGTGSTASAANILANPSFEIPALAAGDQFGATGWTVFGGGTYTIKMLPHTGDQAFKTFGTTSGGFQDFPASPGQVWEASAWAANPTFDPMGTGQVAAVNIEWHDSGGGLINFLTTPILVGGTDPADSVYKQGIISGAAPSGTTTARIVLITGNFAGPGGGAPFFDDASFSQVPEPASIALIAGMGGLLTMRRRA
jgi:hypothetical protein